MIVMREKDCDDCHEMRKTMMIVMREKDRHWADEREAPGSVCDGTVVVHATNTLHAKAIVHCIEIHSTLYRTLLDHDTLSSTERCSQKA